MDEVAAILLKKANAISKTVFDLLFTVSGLLLLSPLLSIIALLVKLSSPGPVFYRGVRTGLHGKPFRIFKFRTMIMGAEKKGGGTTAHNDPRVTKIGKLLRRYKLDELPQLLNIIKREMSVVGPRPELPMYTKTYTKEEQKILSVRPGITDYSSIEFSALDEVVGSDDADRVYEQTVYKRKNELRLKYVQDHNIFLDIKLIFLTIIKILQKAKPKSHGKNTIR